MSQLIKRLQQRWILEGDVLAKDALDCIRELEKSLNALVAAVDPSESKRRTALRNAHAVLRKLQQKEKR